MIPTAHSCLLPLCSLQMLFQVSITGALSENVKGLKRFQSIPEASLLWGIHVPQLQQQYRDASSEDLKSPSILLCCYKSMPKSLMLVFVEQIMSLVSISMVPWIINCSCLREHFKRPSTKQSSKDKCKKT